MNEFFSLYGGPLAAAFFGTFFLLTILLLTEKFFPQKTFQHHSASSVSRFGGIALTSGFIFMLWQSEALVFPLSWWIFISVLIVALCVGITDDLKNLAWPWQLFFQSTLLLLLYLGIIQSESISVLPVWFPELTSLLNGGMALLFFLFWGILILNALNWLDGIDGLAASVHLVTFSTLFVLALSPSVYQPPIAIFLAIAIGTTLAFLVYNFPPAKIMAGTAGSLFFGLLIVFISVVAGTKVATVLLVLALPILDTFFVLWKRWREGRSLFSPDKAHLHHVLLKRGWSAQKILSGYSAITFAIALVALNTESLGKGVALLMVFAFLFAILTYFHFKNRASSKGAVITSGIFLLLVLVPLLENRATETKSAFIAANWFRLEVADSPEERAVGLSKHEALCERCGMIFTFPKNSEPLFWMKDMNFSIDILWVQNGRVIGKNENLPFPSEQTFGPPGPVDYVVELPAGGAKNIQIGDKVFLWP